MCNGYNGYANYETWVVNLWLGNGGSTQDICYEIAASYPDDPEQVGCNIRDMLEELCNEYFSDILVSSSLFSDLLNSAFRSVEWRDIGEHWIAGAIDAGYLVKCADCGSMVLPGSSFDVSDTYYTDGEKAFLCGSCIDDYEIGLEYNQ